MRVRAPRHRLARASRPGLLAWLATALFGVTAAVTAALAVLVTACGGTPLYGPAEPGAAAGTLPSISLQLFQRVETGALARACQADTARFSRDSRRRRLPPALLAQDAYRVAGDVTRWWQAMRRTPVPPGYGPAKAGLLQGLSQLQQGWRDIGDGLLYGKPGRISRGRAGVRAGTRILSGGGADVSL